MPDILPLLEDLGVEGLRSGEREITGLCPVHEQRTGHRDTHPSWSINRSTGAWICFSCGGAGSLASLYTALGHAAPPTLMTDIQTSYVKSALQSYTAPPTEPEVPDTPLVLDLYWLRSLDPVPLSLCELRYFTQESATTFDVRWDKPNRRWVIPIKRPDGELIGVQYRQRGSHPLNYPTAVPKSETLFGLDVYCDEPTVAVVESPLDVVRLHTVGIPAVATYGVYASEEQVSLLARNFRVVVLAFDNDKAGAEGFDRVGRMLRRRGCPTLKFSYTSLREFKDPGDVPDDDRLLHAWKTTVIPTLAHR